MLFIHGAEEMIPGKNQNSLSDANVARLVEAYNAYEDEERFSRIVDLERDQG